MCLADVTSANVVGYETLNILKDDMTMFGMQFERVGGGSVKFGDLKGSFNGGPSQGESDNIMVWKDGQYHYYYFYYDEFAEDPSWNNLWYNDQEEEATEETIDPGFAAWYVRRGDATTLNVSGQVKLTPTTITILANDMTMFTSPYPTAVTLGSLNIANPFGGASQGEADNLMIWKNGQYHYYYFYYDEFAEDPSWNNLWYNDQEEEATEETIDPGIAAWYVRRSTATTLSFTSPLAK